MKNHALTNFNVPIMTKDRFDRVCEISGRTRTSVLIELMERHIVDQTDFLQSRNHQFERIDGVLVKLRSVDQSFDVTGQSTGRRSDHRQNGFKTEEIGSSGRGDR
jgi:hypothetical protein